MATHRPATIEALCEVVQTAVADSTTLEIRGGGSKSAIGAPAGAPATSRVTGPVTFVRVSVNATVC
jgi:hypothetical protein